MTCKDCVKYPACTNSLISPDEDGCAEWCDEFVTVHKSKTVEFGGYTVHQTGYNFHVTLYKDGKMVAHFNCTNEQTEEELKEFVGLYEQMTTHFDDIYEGEEK